MATKFPKQNKENQLNMVNMRLLLDVLNPQRHDIIVSYTDTSKAKEWYVKNNKNQKVFSFKDEEVQYEDGRYTDYCHHLTLSINGIDITVDTRNYGYEWDKKIFMDRELRQALEIKLDAQNKEEKLQKAAKQMSAQDKMIKNYLENMLQK